MAACSRRVPSADSSASAEAKVDPACVALTSRIEGLRKEGIADKIEKASAKKYKMTQADLTKADQLTKANAEFQVRCSRCRRSRPRRRSSRARRQVGFGRAELLALPLQDGRRGVCGGSRLFAADA